VSAGGPTRYADDIGTVPTNIVLYIVIRHGKDGKVEDVYLAAEPLKDRSD
jgi:hypothetical protein